MSDLEPNPPDTERVTPTPPRPPVKKSSRSTSIALVAALLYAVAGLAFAGGRLTAPAAASSGLTFQGGPNRFPLGSPGPGGGPVRALGGTLRGEVTAITSDSITIKLADGSSMTVALSADTTYHSSVPASPSEVTVGSTVAVQPGTIDAQPGASFDPQAGPGGFNFGPASDVTVVAD
jgi:hypothetical protein